MRKLAMLSTALLGLGFSHHAFAQQNAAPQPGLPPGFSAGAPTAQPPNATGDLTTTRVGPAVRPVPTVRATRVLPSQRRRARRAARARARAAAEAPAPAAQ